MSWFETAREEIETFFDVEQQIPEEEGKQRTIRAIDAFHGLFLRLAGELRIRDDWPNPHCHIVPFGTGIIERFAKTHGEITMGVSLYGWFIEAPILAPEQIRHMKDEYWAHIVKLAALGKAELHDHGRPCGWSGAPEVRQLVQHKCSLVYAIARDFTLLVTHAEGCSSLGSIHISLPLESDEAAVLAFYRGGLEGLYRSNYLLYRSAYLQRHRALKKHGLREVDGVLTPL